MSQFKRKRFFVDAWIQRSMLARVVVYWFSGLLVISELVLCWDIANSTDRSFFEQFNFNILWTHHAPVLVASLFVLPFVLLDTLLVTGRFVGPIDRLRRSMRALAAGERVEPLRFRNDDFWQGVAEEFNAIAERQEQLKKQAPNTSAQEIGWTSGDFEPEVAI